MIKILLILLIVPLGYLACTPAKVDCNSTDPTCNDIALLVTANLLGPLPTLGQVKSYTKISNTTGFPIPLNVNDFLGSDVISPGDIDGDGLPDLMAGAHVGDGGGSNRGIAFSILLNSDGTVKAATLISDLEPPFAGVLLDNDTFGWDLRPYADINGDGRKEILIGAGGTDDGADNNVGRVYILFLNADGSPSNFIAIDRNTPGLAGLVDADQFGTGLATIGDVDGDGVQDIAVGAIGDAETGPILGAVYVLLMSPLGTVNQITKIAEGRAGFSGDLNANDGFGQSLAGPGDLNGDGIPDLIVGSPGDDTANSNAGAIWILYLNRDGTVQSDKRITFGQFGFNGLLEASDNFGNQVSAPGDLNRDGFPDLIVSADRDDDGGLDRGALWILFMDASQSVLFHSKISNTEGNFAEPLADADTFGYASFSIGDLNGDRVPDLAASAPRDDDGTIGSGSLYILFLEEARD